MHRFWSASDRFRIRIGLILNQFQIDLWSFLGWCLINLKWFRIDFKSISDWFQRSIPYWLQIDFGSILARFWIDSILSPGQFQMVFRWTLNRFKIDLVQFRIGLGSQYRLNFESIFKSISDNFPIDFWLISAQSFVNFWSISSPFEVVFQKFTVNFEMISDRFQNECRLIYDRFQILSRWKIYLG